MERVLPGSGAIGAILRGRSVFAGISLKIEMNEVQ